MPDDKGEDSELERFEALARSLAQVPKEEVDELDGATGQTSPGTDAEEEPADDSRPEQEAEGHPS